MQPHSHGVDWRVCVSEYVWPVYPGDAISGAPGSALYKVGLLSALISRVWATLGFQAGTAHPNGGVAVDELAAWRRTSGGGSSRMRDWERLGERDALGIRRWDGRPRRKYHEVLDSNGGRGLANCTSCGLKNRQARGPLYASRLSKVYKDGLISL